MQNNNNKATISIGGAVSSDCYWNPGTFQAASETYMANAAVAGLSSIYLGVRLTTPGAGTTDGYRVYFDEGLPPLVRLQRLDDGVATQLGANFEYPTIIGVNSGVGLRAQGTELTAWIRDTGVWSTVPTISRFDSTYSGGGYIGFGQINSVVSSMDDFGGGNIPGNVGSFPTHLGGRGAGW